MIDHGVLLLFEGELKSIGYKAIVITYMRKLIPVLILTLIPVFGVGGYAFAQSKGGDEDFRGIERWAFKTNAMEWLLTIPNFGVEFDLSKSVYNRSTLGMSVEYNFPTWHSFRPATVFNLFDGKLEYRYYKRPEYGKKEYKKEPKTWRAYYYGAYLNAGTYAVKFGKYGHQGMAFTAGFSMGYGIPMYEYRSGAIDVELGFSVGVGMASDNVFTRNADEDVYVPEPSKTKGLHFMPFPVVSDLTVAFVWRKSSIKDKYVKVDRIKQQEAMDRKVARQQEKEEKKAARIEKAKAAEDGIEEPGEKVQKKDKRGKEEKVTEKKTSKEKPEKKEKPVKEKKEKKEKPVKEKKIKKNE